MENKGQNKGDKSVKNVKSTRLICLEWTVGIVLSINSMFFKEL